MFIRTFSNVSALAIFLFIFASGLAAEPVPVEQFVNFESAHVHPLDKTPDGSKLLAVNTANNTLEVFSISGSTLRNIASIPVGHDPVSVRVRNNSEAWVANVISDTVSIVDLNQNVVVRTLQTENEPSDIVFAGSPLRAFVSCAERESIQVFNLNNLNAAPQEILLIGEQPRAMAVSPDGNTVYTAFFESGNQTTVISGNDFIANGGLEAPGSGTTIVSNDIRNPAGPYGGAVPVPNAGSGFNPPLNPALPLKTDTQSLVVKKQPNGRWLDDNNGDWTNIVSGGAGERVAGWDMKDRDVAILNANTLALSYQNTLGNILMAMAVNPVSGKISVVGTDSRNHIRFEPNINGTFLRVNVSQFTPGSDAIDIIDLNPHLDYSTPTVPEFLRFQSTGDPRGIAWTADGNRAYVSGMGSNNIIVINSNGSRSFQQPIPVGEGPTGIVVDEERDQVYVLNKFSGSITVLDSNNNTQTAEAPFFDPTPSVIKTGRRHLYDTHKGSGNGTISCASCHVDGKWDRLGWDLGNPAGEMKTVNGQTFHPLKGLKITQPLIDIINGTALHWRGDKAEFKDFHTAFEDLKGRGPVADSAMAEFSDFLSTTYHPPNPYREAGHNSPRNLNNNIIRGPGTSFQNFTLGNFQGTNAIGFWHEACGGCHTNDSGKGPSGQSFRNAQYVGNENLAPDIRMLYRKLGFYYGSDESTVGFGMMSDGVVDTEFFKAQSRTDGYFFDYHGLLLGWAGGGISWNPSSTAVIRPSTKSQHSHYATGRQATLNGSTGSVQGVNNLRSLADNPFTLPGTIQNNLGLIVKGIFEGEARGFVYLGNSQYQSDTDGVTISHTALVSAAQSNNAEPLTWTLVHEHVATRMGVDRDADDILDFDDPIIDSDGDGLLDQFDPDDDNDQVIDSLDAFPLDPTESVDSDGDLVGDNSDAFPNDASESTDADGDGIGDNADIDADNDGLPDEVESKVGLDSLLLSQMTSSTTAFEQASSGSWVSITRDEYNAIVNQNGVNRFGTAEANMKTGTFNNFGGGQMYTFGQSNNPSPANVHVFAFKRGSGAASVGNNDIVRLSSSNTGNGFNPVGSPLPNGQINSNEEFFILKGADATVYESPQYLGLSTDQNNPIYYAATGTTGRYRLGSTSSTNTAGFGWSIQGLSISANEVNQSNQDVDGDGIPNSADLDSDNDSIADVVEAGLSDANGDFLVDSNSDQGTIVNAPDTDGDGIPDFLDLESNNASNDGTDFDIASTQFASLDTNGDGRITEQDAQGATDANNNGVVDAVEEGDPIDPNDTIQIDGDVSDWSSVRSYQDTPGENTSPGDFETAWFTSDTNKVYIAYRDRQTINPVIFWAWHVLIDTDSQTTTGFNDGSVGADYMLTGDRLFKYAGTGDDWQWTLVQTVSSSINDNFVEFAIDRSNFGQATQFRLHFYAGNTYADGITDDFFLVDTASNEPLIQIDGNAADWSSVPSYQDTPGENTSPGDFETAWFTSDTNKVYIAYRDRQIINLDLFWAWHVLIDTDSQTTTGFNDGSVGADYMLTGDRLFKYAGTGDDWQWTLVQTVSSSINDNFVEFAVDRSNLGQATQFRLHFYAGNTYADGTTNDFFLVDTASNEPSIQIDGNAADWSSVPSYQDTPGENTSPGDFETAWFASDSEKVYIAYRDRQTINLDLFWAWHVLIDTDSQTTTGFNDGSVGADYMLTGDRLFKYAGTGDDWQWTLVQTVSSSINDNFVEFAIDRNNLGQANQIRLNFFAGNTDAGGTTNDFFLVDVANN